MAELFETNLTVSELTSLIKRTLEEGFYGLSVSGEISNFRPSSTGHWFFTLKDEGASISAVMFKSSTWRVDFPPRTGTASRSPAASTSMRRGAPTRSRWTR
ncbi:MAG TPA: exodeoxyribonuclease VII large subunit [Sphaerochaeta sp.]|nr:exodeoxyribonuclease VII large subunit [Sphaerochaeta sp.]